MRRIRHLDHCDYIIPIGQKTGQVLLLSNQSNCLLERTWQGKEEAFELKIHVKFNTDSMNGVMILVSLLRNGQLCSSYVPNVQLYQINEANWGETLVSTVSLTESSPGIHTATVPQSTFGLRELSGREVYAVSCTAQRKRGKYRNKVWFNHLGCYDNIIRIKQDLERLDVVKVDE